ncbi:MAG: hypothetical protein F6J93_19095 [Oscillatoria sp. SIO1A7]|nr:hypothetical protein [Oscillatoria sp. SIO1A7]
MFIIQDLRIPSICVGAIRESPLHLGLYFQICVSPVIEIPGCRDRVSQGAIALGMTKLSPPRSADVRQHETAGRMPESPTNRRFPTGYQRPGEYQKAPTGS